MSAIPTVHYGDVRKRPAFLKAWDRHRHSKALHWLPECFAEALGVWLYTYGGVGSTVPFVVALLSEEPPVGSLLQVGFGYAFGILLAICVCAATSGGHFNPCVTVAHMVYNGFPVLKGLRYITAQVIGGYIACVLVYFQNKTTFQQLEAGLIASGKFDAVMFTPNGPAGILALYQPTGTTIGQVFLNEFVTDFLLALAIWTALDPTNILVPPAAGPWLISFAYAVAIWGFALAGLAANTARDVGGRLAAVSIYGLRAGGGKYAALAALTNIAATLFAVLIYEMFLHDSDRVIPAAQLEFQRVHDKHRRTGTHKHGSMATSHSDESDLKRDEQRTESV